MSRDAQSRIVHPGGFRGGVIRVPGDKSMSHRAVLLAGISRGTSEIRGFLQAGDCLNTVRAMEALGARASLDASGVLRVTGTGGKLLEPARPLDVGNSGTGMRLLAGLCAGTGTKVTLTGDEGLRRRPMERIQKPLELMGAKISLSEGGVAPIRVEGGGLRGIEYCLPVASAQVKTCCLLAGLFAEGETAVVEPVPTRDHTERLLKLAGADIEVQGRKIRVKGHGAEGPKFQARAMEIPGDFSSAAYWLAAGAAIPGTTTRVEGVGLNPRRTAFLGVLERMGAKVTVEEGPSAGGAEPTGNVTVEGAELRGTEVGGEEIPNLIDELPLVAVLGAVARGRTTIRDAEEMRSAESDRVATIVENLERMGVMARGRRDGLTVEGPGGVRPAGAVRSFGDHRVAMALAVLSIFADCPVCIMGVSCVEKSYPGFWEQLKKTGVNVE
jgi:3-phosphoshikimate 1-carboxyvinyltransferase